MRSRNCFGCEIWLLQIRLPACIHLRASCAGEIKRCSQLRELSLEANRLSAPVIDLRSLAHLRSLQLFGNPLDFLPELTPCSSLRHLSLANVSGFTPVHLLPQSKTAKLYVQVFAV